MNTPRIKHRTATAAVLWAVTAALMLLAAGKIGLYGHFEQSARAACDAVADHLGDTNLPDDSYPCEQLAPLGWYLPYWLTVLGYAAFAAMFAVAAVGFARSRPWARAYIATTAILTAALCAVPGLLDAGWRWAVGSANQADRMVAERIRDDVPGWFTVGETTLQALVLAGSALAIWLVRRAGRG